MFNNINKFLFLALFTVSFVLSPLATFADTIQKIKIQGNKRVETETVIAYLGVNQGDPIEANTENEVLKNLFATGLFKNVIVEVIKNGLSLTLEENPIINEVLFEGNEKLKDKDLIKEVTLKPRSIFSKAKKSSDVQRITEIYKRLGRYSVIVEAKVIELDDNRINVIYNITEGTRSEIKEINFVGNKVFSDSRLRGVILTEETEWYRFLSHNDTYDPDRIAFDQELLRKYYLSRGYPEFAVVSVDSKLANNKDGFIITFEVDEGEKYNFGKVEIDSSLEEITSSQLSEHITISSGEEYDAREVEKSMNAISDSISDRGYAFAQVVPRTRKNIETKTIDLVFSVQEGPRVYIERIDIVGNVRTLDSVIRRELLLAEGDAFSSSRLKRSEQRVKNLNYFKSVKFTTQKGSREDKTIVVVDVKEKPTGSLMLSAGFSTKDGPLAGIKLRENNLLGTGDKVGASLGISQKTQNIDLFFARPYFLDRDLTFDSRIFHIRRDNDDKSSFVHNSSGGEVGFGYNLSENLTQTLKYGLSRDEISNISTTASPFIIIENGDTLRSYIEHNLIYDTRDSKLSPRDGLIIKLKNKFSGVGGNVKYIENTLSSRYYRTIVDDVVFILHGEGGIIEGVDGDRVRLADRFFVGGNKVRGFDRAGIGPRDPITGDALGGTRYASGFAEINVPFKVTEFFNLTGAAFFDAGMLTDPDLDAFIPGAGRGIFDNSNVRTSAGVGVMWKSPLGPVRIDVAWPITDEPFDDKRLVKVGFGTRF